MELNIARDEGKRHGEGGKEAKLEEKETRMKQKEKSSQGFPSRPPELTTGVYALKYMIIRFYGSEPQGPGCLSVNNRLQGKARV